MPLAPPSIGVPADGAYNLDLPTLVAHVNEHAVTEGYAVVIARTKPSKKDVKFKPWLRCNCRNSVLGRVVAGGVCRAVLKAVDFGIYICYSKCTFHLGDALRFRSKTGVLRPKI